MLKKRQESKVVNGSILIKKYFNEEEKILKHAGLLLITS